jgi:hypothetical protein
MQLEGEAKRSRHAHHPTTHTIPMRSDDWKPTW